MSLRLSLLECLQVEWVCRNQGIKEKPPHCSLGEDTRPPMQGRGKGE